MPSIDEIAAYWDERPCNVRHSKAPVGSEEWSHEVTVKKYAVEPHIKGFARFPEWQGKRVLEIGCGIGTDTLSFLKAGARVSAMDLSFESVRIAEVRCFRQSYAAFTVENAEDWVPAGPFDLVYSFGVLHHTLHPERVLANVYPELRGGGALRLMLYAKWSIKWLMREQPEAQAGCPYVKWYTKKEARRLVEEAGFRVTSICKTHIFPWRVADYVEGRYVKRWYYRCLPRRLFESLERVLGHHLLIEAVKE